jgi:hypothetical protein
MSKIHYFQRYSQRENAVTNNTMLLLSRLYNDSPKRFEDFLNSLISDSDTNCDIGPNFSQQEGNATRSSTPDAAITQSSLKLLIETKLYDNQDKGQLLRHLDGFTNEDCQILLLINPTDPTPEFNKVVIEAVAAHNEACKTSVRYSSTTFKQIISALEDVLAPHDVIIFEILNDYRDYCASENLLSNHEAVMRAITSGGSFPDNMEYGIYYDPISRGYSPHNYIGLYNKKSVRAIGELSKVVQAQFDKESKTFESITSISGGEPTEDELDRIKGIMHAAMNNNGWNIYKDHKFFIVEKFHPTNFPKTTKYPIQRTKFFDLGSVLERDSLPSCEEVAQLLTQKSWG